MAAREVVAAAALFFALAPARPGGCNSVPPGGIDPNLPAVLVQSGGCPASSTLTLALPALEREIVGLRDRDCAVLEAAVWAEGARVFCDETGGESEPLRDHVAGDPLCAGLVMVTR